jgi:hypothetical protein
MALVIAGGKTDHPDPKDMTTEATLARAFCRVAQ